MKNIAWTNRFYVLPLMHCVTVNVACTKVSLKHVNNFKYIMFAYSRCIISKAYLSKSTLNQQICHPWELKVRLPLLREWCKTTLQTTNSSLNIQERNQIFSNLQSYWRAPGYGNPAWFPTTIMSTSERILTVQKLWDIPTYWFFITHFLWVSRVSNSYLSEISLLTTHSLQRVSCKRSKMCETISFPHQFDPSDPAVFSNLGAT